MAPAARGFLAPILLVLLASGTWARYPENLSKLEGSNISVTCRYSREEPPKAKGCCQWTSMGHCDIMVTSRVQARDPRCSFQYERQLNTTRITMALLRVQDSGLYCSWILEYPRIFFCKKFRLVVTKATSPPITRKAPTVTAVDPAISIGVDSPPGELKWRAIVVGVVVTILTLLWLAILSALYFWTARAGRGDSEPQHSYQDLPAEREEDAVSRSFGQQLAGAICCASFIENPGDSSTPPAPQPEPDRVSLVEYASISFQFHSGSRGTEVEVGGGHPPPAAQASRK